MRLYGLLQLVIALLRYKGRLTYAALQHEFGLDEAALDAIRHELIFAERVATEEAGRVLVWTGEASAPPVAVPLTTRTPVSGSFSGREGSRPGWSCPCRSKRASCHARQPLLDTNSGTLRLARSTAEIVQTSQGDNRQRDQGHRHEHALQPHRISHQAVQAGADGTRAKIDREV